MSSDDPREPASCRRQRELEPQQTTAPAAKRPRKATKKGLDAEILQQGLSVGMEEISLGQKKGKSTRKPKDKSEKKAKEKKGKGTKRGKSRRKQTNGASQEEGVGTFGTNRHDGPQMMSAGDIWDTANIGEEANANLDRAALPYMTERKKKEAFEQLISFIPLEDQSMAAKEVKHLKQATIKLGKRKCLTDGNGDWKLKGMTSSLK